MAVGSTFATFLERSLVLLKRHAAPAYEEVARRLGPRVVAVFVDGEELAVAASSGGLRVSPVAPRSYAASARTTASALVELLEGHSELVTAIWHDRVELRGALTDLLAFYDALRVYFRAAVTCPEFASLLQDYLQTCIPEPEPGLGREGDRP